MTQPADDAELKAALYLLQDYLKEEKRRRDKGITLERIHDELVDLKGEFTRTSARTDAHHRRFEIVIQDQIAQGLRLDRYGKRLRKLERKLFENEPGFDENEETTGNYRIEEVRRAQELAELRKKVEDREHEQRESGIWWRRQRWLWVGAIALAVFVSSLSVVTGYFLYKMTTTTESKR